MNKNIPTEPGFYWAKGDKNYGWYNLVVRIYGGVPYLRFEAWNIASGGIERGSEPGYVFGDRIEEPSE
jgi:hypothetical protein